jgi:hypothetical protein
MKHLLSFFLVATAFTSLSAQTTAIMETNPTGLSWYQVSTPHFKVLYPKGFDAQGQRVANTLEALHAPEARTLGTKPRKITVLLQNQSAVSNGFVTILPRRSEFYTMPSQNYNFLGTNDWLNLLASHEYRHVVQYQHATRGFNRALYYVFGATTLAGMSQAAAPRWFWEGDAVATETAFTPSGRGRIPYFGLAFRTNLMEGRQFNYHKQYLRSYKNFIPDHYVLGYHMISYLRKRTGDPEIWGKITARSWNVPFIPFRFSSAIHKETGLYVTQLYREMAKDLAQQWQDELKGMELTPFEKVNGRLNGAYTDYLYPQVQADGSIIALKKGIGDIEQFVRIGTDGREQKVFVPGIYNDTGMLSGVGSKVVWNEYGYHPRWGVRNYSRIKVYDATTKGMRIIGGRRDRLAGTALSPDGKTLVTVKSGQDYNVVLQFRDFATGNVIRELPNPQNDFYSMPRWSADGLTVVVLKTAHNQRSVVQIDVATGAAKELLPPSPENVGYPVLTDKYLLFNSPVSGFDNIYAVDLTSGQRYKVTSSKFGSYNPALSPDGKTLFYNEQTRDGMDVVKTAFDPSGWKRDDAKVEDDPLAANLVAQEGHAHIFDSIPQTTLPVKKYSKLKGILNPYTWGPYTDNTFAQATFGLASQDRLSTTRIDLGLTYDINEQNWSRRAAVSYQGLFPIIDFQYLAGSRENNESLFGYKLKFTWKENTVEGGLRIPLTLTQSKYLSNLTLGNHVGLTRVTDFLNVVKNPAGAEIYRGPRRGATVEVNGIDDPITFYYEDQVNSGDLIYNRASLSYYHVLKTSYRDFLYRWGQTLDVESYSTPFSGTDFQGNLFAVRSTLYFPGVGKHHYLYGRFGYQSSQQTLAQDDYIFRNRIPKPRGYSYPQDETFAAASVNYALPLWYPDISLGPVLNIQRLRLNMFYDYGQGTGQLYFYSNQDRYVQTTDDTYQSFGGEATVDFNFMRFLPQFNLGVRTTYRTANKFENSGVVVEFLVGNIGF